VVLHLPDRVRFVLFVLGLHAALWPHGNPPLTRGRLLWMFCTHAVLSAHWFANEPRLFQMKPVNTPKQASYTPVQERENNGVVPHPSPAALPPQPSCSSVNVSPVPMRFSLQQSVSPIGAALTPRPRFALPPSTPTEPHDVRRLPPRPVPQQPPDDVRGQTFFPRAVAVHQR
jgi:hypothetical protein